MFLVDFPLLLAFVIISTAAFIFFFSLISTKVLFGTGLVLIIIFLGTIFSVSLYTNAMWKSKEYIISPDRIIIIDGIFGKRQRVHNVKGNTGMQLHQTPIKKFFDYGTITLSFMGGEKVTITNVSKPEKKILLIEELIDKGEVEI